MDKFKEDLLSDFVLESREHLEAVEPSLLEIEANIGESEDSSVPINEVFRAIHSLKGSAAFFGFDNIKGLAHLMENLLMKARDHELNLDKDQINTLISGGDKLSAMVEDLQNCSLIDTSVEVKALQKYLGEESDHGKTSDSNVGAPETKKTLDLPVNESALPQEIASNHVAPEQIDSINDEFSELDKKGSKFYQVIYSLERQIYSAGKTPQETSDVLGSVGTVLHCDTDFRNLPAAGVAGVSEIQITFIIATVLDLDFIVEGLEIDAQQVSKIDVDKARAATRQEGAADDNSKPNSDKSVSKESATAKNKKPSRANSDTGNPEVRETLRVDVSALNNLMDLAGELVLNRNQLKQITDKHGKDIGGLVSLMQSIDIVTSDLQSTIMNARLQPIGVLFNKFPRVIRDLSRQLNKEIDLIIEGKDVDLDKSIIEILSDPLTHLIRNCADHAIETPEVRLAAKKPRRGTVYLKAYHKSGQVYIDIIDDGAGIDPDKIKSKVIEKGLKTPEQLEGLPDPEILKMIFLPGFSMAAEVTEVSGRGVGMDVVRTNIEKLGGSINLNSTLGEGSTVTLKLPLTLAIIPSQIIEAGGVMFAVPQVNLEEMVQIGGKNSKYKIEEVNNREVLRLRGDLLPLVDMSLLLKSGTSNGEIESIESSPTNTSRRANSQLDDAHEADGDPISMPEDGSVGGESEKRNVMILASGANRFGLIVNELLDSEEIVVKPLSSYLNSCKYYAGATILGDGKVSMIIDVAGLAEKANLDFESVKAHNQKTIGSADSRERKARAQFFVFESGAEERFALPLPMISRVDKIRRDNLQLVDGKTFFTHDGKLIRLIWLHEYMQATPPVDLGEFIHVIIPKIIEHPVGVCATSIHDIVELNIELNCSDHTGRGVVGSAVIDGSPVLFLDLFGLLEMAAPELYGSSALTGEVDSSRVLIAESNYAHFALISRVCESVGLTPTYVNNGIEAFQALQSGSYRVVLTAPHLTVLDTEALISQVRTMESGKEIPFIALTDLAEKKRPEDIYVERIQKFDKPRLLNALVSVANGAAEA